VRSGWGACGVGGTAALMMLALGGSPPPRAAGSRPAVVVELFTSEGCSSCPPADRALERLERPGEIPGVEVIGLSEHVDYWNRLGWADPFSSPRFTARQEGYVASMHLRSAYTPQMVIDGRTELVGSYDGARAAILEAARRPKAAIELSAAPDGARALLVRATVSGAAAAGLRSDGDLLLAITESGLASDVASGENAGRHLTHASVVRWLRAVGPVRGSDPGPAVLHADVELDPSWVRAGLRLVAILQDGEGRAVRGAAAASVPPAD
jgi:hypothetical protein